MGYLAQPGEPVELQVMLPDDEAPGVADRRDVHRSLGEDLASGDSLAPRRPGA
jgi:hypothetical protein